MFPNVIAAYNALGFDIRLGSPSWLPSHLVDRATGVPVSTGGGLSASDAFFFSSIARTFTPEAIFIIGNAFGLSTFTLAELFPEALIDVIDAECEGEGNARGSELTRKIAAGSYPKVRLITGFSPQDVSKACRVAKYQLVFIDGLHTNEQMCADFLGIVSHLDTRSIVVFHDVGSHRMLPAWEEVVAKASAEGFEAFQVAWTSSGICVLARGIPAVQTYLHATQGNLAAHRFYLGIPFSDRRPKFWHRTLLEIEHIALRKLKQMFGAG